MVLYGDVMGIEKWLSSRYYWHHTRHIAHCNTSQWTRQSEAPGLATLWSWRCDDATYQEDDIINANYNTTTSQAYKVLLDHFIFDFRIHYKAFLYMYLVQNETQFFENIKQKVRTM